MTLVLVFASACATTRGTSVEPAVEPEPADTVDAPITSHVFVAMVAMAEPAMPPVEDLARWMGADGVDAGDTAFILSRPGMRLGLASMPMPIPWSEIEGPCAAAWPWLGYDGEPDRVDVRHAPSFVGRDGLVMRLEL